jgi:TonB family protein
MRAIVGLFVLALVGAPTRAQEVVLAPGAAEFRWTSVHVMVIPDTAMGVEVIFTMDVPQLASNGDVIPALYYDQTFEPSAAGAWAASAESLLATPAARRPLTLVGRDSSLLVIAWDRSEGSSSRTVLAVYPRADVTDQKPLDVRVDSADAWAFLDALRAKAAMSRVDPHAPLIGSSAGIYTVESVKEKPMPISFPPVSYPEDMRLQGIQGTVILQAIVDTLGRVEPASVRVVASPYPAFSDAARKQILKTVFRPARLNGRAVRVLIKVPVRFTLAHR